MNIDIGLLILSITVAGLMLFYGIAKLNALDRIKSLLSANGFPEFMAYGVFITEIIAPLLIGFRAKFASLVFFFGMLSAMFLTHAGELFSITKTGGVEIELILLYALGAVVFVLYRIRKIRGIKVKYLRLI
ncbi:putative oxidoreductase [Mesonia algae]|uniref:Putative oxidoreductase n=1 Tax=Mesonia algae TaxID=213248 RepID=A0A2W7IT35_9FLAO|nr:DoxX family membrane protein [Mesonia algae]PZW42627.1 putative oxidoreductase [Mesonia algae]